MLMADPVLTGSLSTQIMWWLKTQRSDSVTSSFVLSPRLSWLPPLLASYLDNYATINNPCAYVQNPCVIAWSTSTQIQRCVLCKQSKHSAFAWGIPAKQGCPGWIPCKFPLWVEQWSKGTVAAYDKLWMCIKASICILEILNIDGFYLYYCTLMPMFIWFYWTQMGQFNPSESCLTITHSLGIFWVEIGNVETNGFWILYFRHTLVLPFLFLYVNFPKDLILTPSFESKQRMGWAMYNLGRVWNCSVIGIQQLYLL